MIHSGVLQQNYFELFKLPVEFDIDASVLKSKQQDIQKQIHPDRFAYKSDQEKRLAMQIASHVNSAYEVLANDLSRAAYILSLQGISTDAENDIQMPTDFLMQQIELREAIENIAFDATGLQHIDAQRQALNQFWQSLIAQLKTELQNDSWELARQTVRKLQFYNKIYGELNTKEAAIEDQILS